MHKLTLSILLLLAAVATYAKVLTVSSPDGKLTAEVNIDSKIHLSVKADGKTVITDCTPALVTGGKVLGDNPILKKSVRGTVDNNITAVVPTKNATMRNHCNTLTLTFKDGYTLTLNVYDKAVAYRFTTSLKGKCQITDERIGACFADGSEAVTSPGNSFRTSCERKYVKARIADISRNGDATYLPILVETPGNYKVLFSETDLYDYPCMFLKGNGSNGFDAVFPKMPLKETVSGDRSRDITEEAPYIAATDGTRKFPWRFFVISKDDRDIAATQMEHILSSPCELNDTKWIKPGKVAWDWWNNWQVWNVDFRAGINYDTYKYYIDFAANNNVDYIILDEGWSASTTDIMHDRSEVRLRDLIAYGKQKGVGIILWTTWLAVENNFNEIFKLYSSWGVAGMKIDFMDRSDQWMVNFYERTVKAAADNHLLVDFHGAFKPAGLEVRYPNLLSYEGIRGMEQGRGCSPDNTMYIPFIRNAVGAADFTPGAMLNVHTRHVNHNGDTPMAAGTRAYQLALYVVLESGIQMLSDSPTRYMQNQECTDYIASVPVTWDKTVIVDARIGEYIVTARKHGTKWYVGAITNSKARTINVPLTFLGQGNHTMTAFSDGINADRQAMDYRKETKTVSSADVLTLNLASEGGLAAVIE